MEEWCLISNNGGAVKLAVEAGELVIFHLREIEEQR